MKNAYKKICLSIISLVLITTLSLPIFAFSEEMPHVQPRNSDTYWTTVCQYGSPSDYTKVRTLNRRDIDFQIAIENQTVEFMYSAIMNAIVPIEGDAIIDQLKDDIIDNLTEIVTDLMREGLEGYYMGFEIDLSYYRGQHNVPFLGGYRTIDKYDCFFEDNYSNEANNVNYKVYTIY